MCVHVCVCVEVKGRKREVQHRTRRPCVFCSKVQTNLARHIVTVHREDQEVKEVLKLPTAERNAALALLRKRGMMEYNRQVMAVGGKHSRQRLYQRERSCRTSEDNLVICSLCKGCFASSYFHRHKRRCAVKTATVPRKVPLPIMSVQYQQLSEEFKTEILANFKKNEIGDLCRNDPCIVKFGAKQYEKINQKPDKASEVKKSVMQDMRRLAHLFLEFKRQCTAGHVEVPTSAADILVRSNFEILRTAVKVYTAAENSDDGIKAGLKHHVFYLLTKFGKFQKIVYLIEENESKAKDVENFLEVLSLNSKDMMGDALFKLHKNRQIRLRKPQEMPSEEDMMKVRRYTENRISAIVSDQFSIWDSVRFAELRDLVVSRLTLFNARRGGEPARLLVSEWKDGENGVWFDRNRIEKLSEEDARLFSEMMLTYQSGKGDKHLVPVLIPRDVVKGMEILCDPEVRDQADVLERNIFMFPATHKSTVHVNGWHSVSRICSAAEVEAGKVTATKQRHRISTLYASLDVSETERPMFYQHLGHSAEMNANVYQAPLAEKEIRLVGSRLLAIDLCVLIFHRKGLWPNGFCAVFAMLVFIRLF